MPKGIVMTIMQEKGGVGKSIATMNLAYFLSRTDRVLVIDLDGQASDITYYMLGNIQGEKLSSLPTIVDVLRERVEVHKTIIPITFNLEIIPANVEVANLSSTLHKVSIYKRIIASLQKEYDYILTDVTPSPTWGHYLALSASEKIVPIINADTASLKALISLNMSVEEVKETSNPNLEYLGIIVNRYDNRTRLSKEVLSETNKIAEQIGTKPFKTKIRQSVLLSEQTSVHASIFDYAPGSSPAKDYEALGNEILERLNLKTQKRKWYQP